MPWAAEQTNIGKRSVTLYHKAPRRTEFQDILPYTCGRPEGTRENHTGAFRIQQEAGCLHQIPKAITPGT